MTTVPIAHLLSIILSFFITYLCIPPIVKISKEKRLFDEPNHRKLNKTVIPTLGGIAIFIGVTLSSIIFIGDSSIPNFKYLYGAMIMLFFVGLKDDILVISPSKKLIVQIAAVLMLVFLGNFHLDNMEHLFGVYHLNSIFSYSLSFLIILFFINSINLIDGIDGLAGGLVLFISLSLGLWFLAVGSSQYAVLSFALSGSLLAFLKFNLWGGKQKIFMGDTGSLVLGMLVSVLIIKFIGLNNHAPIQYQIGQVPTVALAFLIVPVTDTLRVFSIRLYQKRSPFSPDMNHIHHILIRTGMSHLQASSFLILYTISFILLSLTIQPYVSVTFSFFTVLVLSFTFVSLFSLRSKIVVERRHIEQLKKLENRQGKVIRIYGPVKENQPVYGIRKRIFQN
ncbi:glycosyltransferase family 4 protein [Sunxiuqinia sp. A32]|uniref:glycosyltransferase family 4 protein n=1 Tax=Sunxiuqinia sp. A32 TaxID=3461496 RepID=UPI00404524F2